MSKTLLSKLIFSTCVVVLFVMSNIAEPCALDVAETYNKTHSVMSDANKENNESNRSHSVLSQRLGYPMIRYYPNPCKIAPIVGCDDKK